MITDKQKLKAFLEGLKTEMAILDGLRQQHEANMKIYIKEIEDLIIWK